MDAGPEKVKKPMAEKNGSCVAVCKTLAEKLLDRGLSLVLCRPLGTTRLAWIVLHQQANRDVSKDLCRCRRHE